MQQKQNSKLAIAKEGQQSTNSSRSFGDTIQIPGFSFEINNLQILQNINGDGPLEEQNQTGNNTGELKGQFSVPKKDFSNIFSFKIPFSLKHQKGIALSFSTNDFSNEKLTQLNQFVFGDEDANPIIIPREIAVEIVTSVIESSKGFEKMKDYWEKAITFMNKNNVSFNIFIDPVQKSCSVGFFWEEFKLDVMPQEIKIKDIIFGLSVNPTSPSNKFAVKIGGKGQFEIGNNNEQNIFIEYSYDGDSQRLEVGATVSILTSLLELLKVQIPQQIKDFAKNTTFIVEWITDSKKKIIEDIKQDKK